VTRFIGQLDPWMEGGACVASAPIRSQTRILRTPYVLPTNARRLRPTPILIGTVSAGIADPIDAAIRNIAVRTISLERSIVCYT
jgi:hypothetical protein